MTKIGGLRRIDLSGRKGATDTGSIAWRTTAASPSGRGRRPSPRTGTPSG